MNSVKQIPNEDWQVLRQAASSARDAFEKLASSQARGNIQDHILNFREQMTAFEKRLRDMGKVSQFFNRLSSHEVAHTFSVNRLYGEAWNSKTSSDREATFYADLDYQQEVMRTNFEICLNGIEAMQYWVQEESIQSEVIDLPTLMSEAIQYLQIGFAKNKGDKSIELCIDEVPNISVSMHRPSILSFFYNFVENATRHRATRIHIQFLGEYGRIVIRDNGNGMSVQKSQNVASAWRNADPALFHQWHLSPGLGMAEMDRKMEAMGGAFTMHAHGGINKGAAAVLDFAKIVE